MVACQQSTGTWSWDLVAVSDFQESALVSKAGSWAWSRAPIFRRGNLVRIQLAVKILVVSQWFRIIQGFFSVKGWVFLPSERAIAKTWEQGEADMKHSKDWAGLAARKVKAGQRDSRLRVWGTQCDTLTWQSKGLSAVTTNPMAAIFEPRVMTYVCLGWDDNFLLLSIVTLGEIHMCLSRV